LLAGVSANAQSDRIASSARLTTCALQSVCQLKGCTSIHQKQSITINSASNLAYQMRRHVCFCFAGVKETSSDLLKIRATSRRNYNFDHHIGEHDLIY
jgi:hypothetical protein